MHCTTAPADPGALSKGIWLGENAMAERVREQDKSSHGIDYAIHPPRFW